MHADKAVAPYLDAFFHGLQQKAGAAVVAAQLEIDRYRGLQISFDEAWAASSLRR